MTETRTQTWQVVNQSPLTVLETNTREPLHNLNNILDSKLDNPFRLSLSSSALTIGSSEIQTKKSNGLGATSNSFKVSTPPINGNYKQISESSITFLNGVFSGDFGSSQNATAPTMTSGYYIWLGIELRSDYKYYLVWGTQASSSGSATFPLFTGGNPVCLILLKDNGTGGKWKYSTPSSENVIIFRGSGSLQKREDSLMRINLIDLIYSSLPTGTVTIDSVSVTDGCLVLFTKSPIEGLYRATVSSGSVTSWEKITDVYNGSSFQVFDGTSYFRTIWKRNSGVWIPLEVADAVKDPTGFPNRTDSTFSFVDATRTFTIQPVSTSFDYFCKGKVFRVTSATTVVIPDVEGGHFIYFNDFTLSSTQTYSDSLLTDSGYVAYIYWDATNKKAIIIGDERHGISMDGATHKYLHLSRGTVLQSGASIGNYTTSGTGANNTDAEISIADARLFDEDIDISISNSASPSSFHQQILSPIAKIPVFYRNGASGYWRKDTSTFYPLKQGTARAQWNKYASGSWSTVDATSNNYFLSTWVFATNSITDPVIALLGQAEYSTLTEAQEKEQYSSLSLGSFPASEFKLCFRLIWETSSTFTNTPKTRLAHVQDLRVSPDAPFPSVSPNDHGLLSGLSDPDHPPTAVTTTGVTKDGGLSALDVDLKQALDTLNKLFGQLRLKEHSTNKKRVVLTSSARTLNDSTVLGQVLGNLMMTFDGAEIDFSTGNVYKSDGVTLLGLSFTPPSIPTNNYLWYSVSLIANSTGSDNTMGVSVMVSPATSSNPSLSSAPKASFSQGQKIGQVYVQANVSGINNITQANIVQLGIGTGSGSGTGDANSFIENLKLRLLASYYQYVTPVVFEIDSNSLISSSTATFNSVDAYNFTAVGQYIISKQMFCDDFLSTDEDSRRVELHAEWYDSSTVDTSATYQVSLDATNYESVTMTRQGTSAKYVGDILMVVPSNSILLSQLTENTSIELNATDIQSYTTLFNVSNKEALREIVMKIVKVGSPDGGFNIKICKDNLGVPGDLVYSKNKVISDLSSGTNTITVSDFRSILTSGTYHLVIETDSTYKSTFSSGVKSISFRADSTNSRGGVNKKYNGSSWTTNTSDSYFKLSGHLFDLRVKITSSSSGKKLREFGIFYDEQVGGLASSSAMTERFTFSGSLNTNSFTVTSFLPDVNHLKVYDVNTAQVYRYPAFSVDGYTITFPVNTFNSPSETITLLFDQSEGSSFDNSDLNANLLAANHLGSTNGSLDKSISGRGIILRNSNNQLVEMSLDATNNWVATIL